MNNEMLELAKELKADALLTRRYQIAKCSVWSDQLINLCEHVEKISQTNEDSAKLIEAFCADDAEWHKLLDKRDEENSTLISLVVKLADKCTEMQQKLEHINQLLSSLPENIKCPTAPELIWLQVDPEPEEENKPVYPVNLYSGDVTWSSSREFPTDTLYVRADFLLQSVKQC
ncbi:MULTISPECIES: hypothetical protein [Providencia]|uniref:hypothetical protein n=1 Tax=Providencia TaxID=586 RepID=UPI001FF4EDA7|nr:MULTISPECIES: hypothetical protein [Providencia]MCK1144367.1 hypothetical protein [Providencia stuartii]